MEIQYHLEMIGPLTWLYLGVYLPKLAVIMSSLPLKNYINVGYNIFFNTNTKQSQTNCFNY